MIKINNDWKDFFETETKKEYYLKLREFLKAEYQTQVIYPPMDKIFYAYQITPFHKIKVVILGQDCYHGFNQAMGLAFSVNDGIKIPPSLRNIYKEIESDIGIIPPNNGNLTRWAEQGVFLLNTALTVREGHANSHSGKGWEIFTDNTIKYLNNNDNPKVFILWGANAKSKKSLITNSNHLILESVHPSPLSASNGFFGCKHFSKTNKFLEDNNLLPINW